MCVGELSIFITALPGAESLNVLQQAPASVSCPVILTVQLFRSPFIHPGGGRYRYTLWHPLSSMGSPAPWVIHRRPATDNTCFRDLGRVVVQNIASYQLCSVRRIDTFGLLQTRCAAPFV
ncbi:hypothetical protein BDZ85DRAFT_126464 [Elsinoe ampelina]|uniref:Uncharacterized protein n=1 Tax=Elsinoe ampelina TaxID=302913 RepID=A0A6A6G988_9PEZI|nr:hypothetical protein BDZ85DRAFT_126464 [Elsinoe ampelina]